MTAFRRLRFFKGLFTQAEDWQAEQTYHVDRLRLHHRSLHTAGIVRGFMDELAVRPAGGNVLEVAPGAAVDGQGRELYLSEPAALKIVRRGLELPGTVFVVLRYQEELTDLRENVAHEEHTGHAFVEESVRLELLAEPPDPAGGVELARIALRARGPVREPRDPLEPGANEIDRTWVRWAGGRLAFSRPEAASPVIGIGEWRGGSTNVTPSETLEPSDDDTYIDIDEVAHGDPHRLYMANVYPKAAEARVVGFLQTRQTAGGLEYRLIIKNFGARTVPVEYRVYRLA